MARCCDTNIVSAACRHLALQAISMEQSDFPFFGQTHRLSHQKSSLNAHFPVCVSDANILDFDTTEVLSLRMTHLHFEID